MPASSAQNQFFHQLRSALEGHVLVKLTLGKYRGAEADLKNLFVRPVELKAGPHLSFVYRYKTRDITKNYPSEIAVGILEKLVGTDFQDAHLFTAAETFQLETAETGNARLHKKPVDSAPVIVTGSHDKGRQYFISSDAPWLHALGVTNERGKPREAMAAKFRQINRFVELLSHLVDDAPLPIDRPFHVVDMGCGKGYLTFATAEFFAGRADVTGIETRHELVALCTETARVQKFSNLHFRAGTIEESLGNDIDVLIALHACDTATDEALAKGIAANAALILVSPCCQKELRPQLVAPPVLAAALRHGIFQERQAEFITDALRAQLLEWAGYRTKVFEFVSTEHTAKNLMIAAIREKPKGDLVVEKQIREFARFYGIRHQKLADHLGFSLLN